MAPESVTNTAPESVLVPKLDGLPVYRLSTPTGFERDRSGRVHWERATYTTDRDAEVVRQHYRTVMQARGWRVTRNEPLADGVMLLTASRGRFEATIRIEPLGDATVITVLVIEITVAKEPPAPEPQAPDRDRVIDPTRP